MPAPPDRSQNHEQGRATARPSGRPAVAGFALLAEVLAVGVMTAIAALGVVTAFGAIAAGCASLREYLEHDTAPGPRRYLALLREASRGAVPLLALPALIAVVAADLLAWHAGVPGGRLLGPAAATVGMAAVVVGLRAAADWAPPPEPHNPRRPPPWAALPAVATTRSVSDWRGSLLILGALAVCATLAFAIPALALILPGLLTLALVAVCGRAR